MERRDQHSLTTPRTHCHRVWEEQPPSLLRHWRNPLAGFDLPYFKQRRWTMPAVPVSARRSAERSESPFSP